MIIYFYFFWVAIYNVSNFLNSNFFIKYVTLGGGIFAVLTGSEGECSGKGDLTSEIARGDTRGLSDWGVDIEKHLSVHWDEKVDFEFHKLTV